MDLLLKLPKTLQSKTNQDVPNTVIERLNFLWNACCNLAINSPDLAHRMSKEFIIISNNFDIDLPDYIGSRICRHCCAIQVPAETCCVRIHKRSNKSRANRLSKEKLRNQIVLQCTLCKKSSVKLPAYNKSSHVVRPDNTGPESNETDSTNPRKRSLQDMKQQFVASSSAKTGSQSVNSAPKFSFLNKQTAPVANIPRSSSSIQFSSLGSSSTSNLRQTPAGKLDSVDFISFGGNNSSSGGNKSGPPSGAPQKSNAFTNNNNNSIHKSNSTGSFSTMFSKNKPLVSGLSSAASTNSMSSLLNSFNGGGLLGAGSAKPSAPLNAVNLLDLEKMNKKKRKSMGK